MGWGEVTGTAELLAQIATQIASQRSMPHTITFLDAVTGSTIQTDATPSGWNGGAEPSSGRVPG
jgi:hypothetical protein